MFCLEPKMLADAPIDERLDKEQLKLSILRRCGSLLPLYTNSELMKVLVTNFFYEKETTITKLIDTTEFEYNPIHNYDRTEEIVRDNELTAGIGSKETATAGKGSNTITTPNTVEETQVSAFDSSDYQPKEKTSNSGTATTATTTNGTDTVETVRNGTDKEHEKTVTRMSGNIGVTTTQKMITDERKVVLFNVYDWIAIEFEMNFCILVS